jgi:hypothetical protein
MSLGIGLGLWPGSRAASAALLDPATLALTAYFDAIEGAYVSPTWPGIASAGSSGTRTLIAGVAPPAASGAPDFGGAGHYLIPGGALKWDSFTTRTAYFGQLVFTADTLAAAAAQPYNDKQLLADNGGNIYVAVNNSGLHFGHYDDASFKSTRTTGYIPISTGTKYVAQFWYDGTNLNVRTNTVTTPIQLAASSFTSAYNLITPRMGGNHDLSIWFDGRIHQWIQMASVPNAATRTSLLEAAISVHGV